MYEIEVPLAPYQGGNAVLTRDSDAAFAQFGENTIPRIKEIQALTDPITGVCVGFAIGYSDYDTSSSTYSYHSDPNITVPPIVETWSNVMEDIHVSEFQVSIDPSLGEASSRALRWILSDNT